VERCRIIVDKQPRLVTVNLWRFLWHARQLGTRFAGRFSGWLWIDALSIAQSNPWEKLEQVKKISNIFEDAEKVIIWLGPAYGDSDRAMKFLATQMKHSPEEKALRGLYSIPAGPAMLELCKRPYWHRLWVYQELNASRSIDVLCGIHCVDLESFQTLLLQDSADDRLKTTMATLRGSPLAKMVGASPNSTRTSLTLMLGTTRHLRCTDPRDKVYAILNVVSSGHQDIDADYAKPLPDLMNQVLRNMHAIEKPYYLMGVGAHCMLLEDVFSTSRDSVFESKCEALKACSDFSSQLHLGSFTSLEVLKSLESMKKIIPMLEDLYVWCKRYNHREIAHVVRTEIAGRWRNLELPEPCKYVTVTDDDYRRPIEAWKQLAKSFEDIV
jgi:hypothetical protein